MKIKVLYLVSTLKRCGPTNQLLNIISGLDSNLFDCMVLTLSSEPRDSLKPKFLNAGINVDSLNLSRFAGLIVGRRQVIAKIKKFAPAVVHSQGIRSDRYVTQLKKYNIRTISTIRCIPGEYYVMQYGKMLGNVMARNHIKSLKSIDQVIAVSNSISRVLQKIGLNSDVIQNGCDTIKFSPVSATQKLELRKKLGLSLESILLISVGHLSKLKDPITIIRAFKSCIRKDKFQLLFIGDGEIRTPCEAEAMLEEERIRFIGRVSNVDEYLKASDVFLSASLSEGLPNTVLESLSCGIPTILSRIPQHQELFGNNFAQYSFFDIGNVKELADILNTFSLSSLNSMPLRQLIEENFDSKDMSRKYQQLYKRLAHIS